MKYAELTRAIIGCAMESSQYPGNGFQEVIYQRSLALELKLQGIPFMRGEAERPVFYKGVSAGSCRVDFFIAENVLVELKAVGAIDDNHPAPGLNDLEAFNFEIGLLVNFGAGSLQFKRLLNKKCSPVTKPVDVQASNLDSRSGRPGPDYPNHGNP